MARHLERLRAAPLRDRVMVFAQEARHAFRMLRKNYGLTIVAALSLALGIGANSAIFSLADAVLLRPLPVRDPNTVMTIATGTIDEPAVGLSYPDYRYLRDNAQSFEGMVAYQNVGVSLAPSPAVVPKVRVAEVVSDNFFQTLGVRPSLGRGFLPVEGQTLNPSPVAILSYACWIDEFAEDPGILNRVIRINGIPFTIVGVAPKNFPGIEQFLRPALYVPSSMAQRLNPAIQDPLEDRTARAFVIKARIRHGVAPQNAAAELDLLWRNLQREYSAIEKGRNIMLRTELQARIQQSPADAGLIAMLTVLVAIVLVIACANVANLLLGHARARSREMAIRLALGVRRLRLLRQLFTESLLLSLLGAIAGLGIAYLGIRFLKTVRPPTDLPIVITPRLDYRVLLVSLLAAVLSALLFGLAPAWQSLKTDLVSALKSGAENQPLQRRMTGMVGRNLLVVIQVALSLVLMVAAGMLLDGFRKSVKLDPGFRTDGLMTMEFDVSLVRYSDDQTRDFYRNLVNATRALSGVKSVALTRAVPFSPTQSAEAIVPEGHQFPNGQESVSIFSDVVDESYFDTMKIPLVRGRAFTPADKLGSRPIVIANEQFCRTYWPNLDPIGKRVRLAGPKSPWLEVVGVAHTGKYLYLAEKPTPYLYLPFAQHPSSRMVLLVETAGEPGAMTASLMDVVHSIDPDQPVYNIRTFSNYYQQRAMVVPRMITEMVATMGTLGLTLALIGLYGLVAYSVARRTREIGVRLAIGANRLNILKLVLRQGLGLALIGMLVGAVASLAVARLLAAGLAGIGAPSALTFIFVPIALFCVIAAACYFPARRASLIDPLKALRYE